MAHSDVRVSSTVKQPEVHKGPPVRAAADKGLRGWEAMDQGGSRAQHTLYGGSQVGWCVRPQKSQNRRNLATICSFPATPAADTV